VTTRSADEHGPEVRHDAAPDPERLPMDVTGRWSSGKAVGSSNERLCLYPLKRPQQLPRRRLPRGGSGAWA